MSDTDPIIINDGGQLSGKFLVATPQMQDPRFARAVIYICNHDKDGAMGLVINKTKDLPLSKMLGHIGIKGEVKVLVVDGDEALIFDTDFESKWTKALAKIGVTPEMLSMTGGSA